MKFTTPAFAIAWEYGTNGSLRRPAVDAVTTMLPEGCSIARSGTL
jgi:hypothetical protein